MTTHGAIKVAKAQELENGWTDVILCCADEECPGIIPVGECFYEDDVLMAVRKEYAACTECGIEINLPSKLWIQ